MTLTRKICNWIISVFQAFGTRHRKMIKLGKLCQIKCSIFDTIPKFVSYKDIKNLMADLKLVYAAPTEETTLSELELFNADVAEPEKIGSAICNCSQILYQFLAFAQDLEQSLRPLFQLLSFSYALFPRPGNSDYLI